jgi:nitrogenase-associated protein
MATIVFYEKPGCGTNASQRRLLESAGHELVVRDLLSESWTAPRLLEFLAALPVRDWFNRAAPRIKSGEIEPDTLSAEAALALLLSDHLLIRRPLLVVGERRLVGFDPQQLQDTAAISNTEKANRLQDCMRLPIPHRPRM